MCAIGPNRPGAPKEGAQAAALEARIAALEAQLADLRASESKLAGVIGATTDSMSMMDRDLTVLWANEPAKRLFGQQLVGRKCYEAYHGYAAPCSSCVVRRVFEDGGVHEHETEVIAADGTRRRFWCTASPAAYDDSGLPSLVVEISRDVTEFLAAQHARAALEQRMHQMQRFESLGVLAGSIAHNFNNLLSVVIGYLELVNDDVPKGSLAADNLAEARKAAVRAADLGAAMLVCAGQGKNHIEELDPGEVIAELEQALPSLLEPNLALDIEPSARPLHVRADRGQLRQAVLNLVTNAAEALDGAGGTIRIGVGVQNCAAEDLALAGLDDALREGAYVYIDVIDNGPGVDEAVRGRIFDPFFTTKFPGRGLGLAAVLGIARGHGGAVLLDTAPGQGARFRLLLPQASGTDVPKV